MKKHVALALGLGMLISIKTFSQTNQLNNSSGAVDTIKTNNNEGPQALPTNKKITITGYIQPQFQIVESNGAPTISGGNFEPNTNNRLIMRRGRLKATFDTRNIKYAIQINATEK